MTVIIFIIVLAVLIFVHELGHFILARLNGIRVDAFKIGFGPRIISWKRGETEYGVNLIPFGGFVQIHGENPDEDSIHGADRERSFINKNRWRQVSVLVAGVFFNFLFAWLLYGIVFMSGVTATKDGFEKYSDLFRDPRVLIGYVDAESPASRAGLKPGDVLVEIKVAQSNTDLSVTNDTLQAEKIPAAVNSSQGQPVSVSFVRNGLASTTMINPQEGIVPGKFAMGIVPLDAVTFRLPFFTAILESFNYTTGMIKETTVGLAMFIANIFHGTANFSDVAGPIGIAGIVGDAAVMGFGYLLMITALISINLGVINLIPFPALDGGRTLFVAIEGLIRRRIPLKFFNITNTVGFILLMILMVAVTYKDIVRLLK